MKNHGSALHCTNNVNGSHQYASNQYHRNLLINEQHNITWQNKAKNVFLLDIKRIITFFITTYVAANHCIAYEWIRFTAYFQKKKNNNKFPFKELAFSMIRVL